MADFNLIPNEYKAQRAKRRVLIKLSSLQAAILLILAACLWISHVTISNREAEAAQLRQQRDISVQEQQKMSQLKSRMLELESQALLLNSLRAGSPIGVLIDTIEAALDQTNVWFLDWEFRRQGIVVANDPVARPPSYFVLAKRPDEFPRQWHNLTHMTIHGEAQDHAALSTFVQQLFKQPTIDDVRVQRSQRGSDGVRFKLAVMIKTAGDNVL